jgi:hypothetical protein
MRRPKSLLPAWMLEVAGERPAHHRPSTPPVGRRVVDAGGAEARIDALAKLKALLDSGVLTDRQFADERARLLGG